MIEKSANKDIENIRKKCCMDLRDVGDNLPEFILTQNIKWLDISTGMPIFNIFNLLGVHYFVKEKEIYFKPLDAENDNYYKILEINNGNPFLELAKQQESYGISYLNNFNIRQELTISMPDINNQMTEDSIKSLSNGNIVLQLKTFNCICIDNINCKTLVLDLRNNSGGKVVSLQKISGYFIGYNQEIAKIKDKEKTYILKSNENQKIQAKKIIILINRYTASCAELLILSLIDRYDTSIIGEETMGKWVITMTRKFSNYYVKIPRFLIMKNNQKLEIGHGIKPSIYMDDFKINKYVKRF